jgi:hypothetical protein
MSEEMQVNTKTRASIHYGINFIVAPHPVVDSDSRLDFQKHLLKVGMEFTAATHSSASLELKRDDPPLKLSVMLLGPQVGQVLLVAGSPNRPLAFFEEEVEQVCAAYQETWGLPKQFLSRDASIRCLYSCQNCPHTFQYLWEGLLGKQESDAAAFERPLQGGGLRFVMPPLADESPEPSMIEVKVESFLKDPSKLFVETHITWPQPRQDNVFEIAGELLDRVQGYVENNVERFITQSRGA